MINRIKFYLSALVLTVHANSASLDGVINLSGVVVNSEYSAESVPDDTNRSIFATKKVSGMEMIILNREPEKPRKQIDISLKDVISQIVSEQNSENMATKPVEESLSAVSSKIIKMKTGNNSIISLVPDRVLEVDYSGVATKLNNYSGAVNSQKILYLTFDDGPLKGTTNVLKILQEEQIDATMFCVGKHVVKKKDIFDRERSMKNLLVVNHTYSHANGKYRKFYSDMYRVLSDVEHSQLIIGGRKFLRLAGRNVWRLPKVKKDDYGLSRNQRWLEVKDYNALYKEGFFIIGWDIEWGFNHRNGMPTSSAKSLAYRIENLHRNGKLTKRGRVVLLSHDFMFRSRDGANELRSFIKIMKQNGWQFRKISHYVSTQPEPLKYVKYYKKGKATLLAKNNNTNNNSTNKTAKSKDSLHSELNNALKEYDAEKVNHILKMGIDPNRQDKYGRLALNTAIKINSIGMVKKLMAHGAKLTAHDKWGNTPLSVAKRYKRRRIFRYLRRFTPSQGNKVVKKHRVAKKSPIVKEKKKRDVLDILRVNPL